jgi:hypothetical protein
VNGARFEAAIGQGGGDQRTFKREAGVAVPRRLRGNVLAGAGEVSVRDGGRGVGVSAAAAGSLQSVVERGNVASGGGGLIAQALGARDLGAAIALGLGSRTVRLRIRRP